jgi:Domain of unknown function (DUF4406)
MTRIYVAGPCSGLPFNNYPAFMSAELQLRALGYDVVNPTTLPGHAQHDQTWESFMRVDLPALCTCDAVALLPGWHTSKGARLEHHSAIVLGMEIRQLADWLLKPEHVAWQAAVRVPSAKLTQAESECPYTDRSPYARGAWLDGWEAAERAHGILAAVQEGGAA